MEELGCHVAVEYLLVGIDLTGRWCTKKSNGFFHYQVGDRGHMIVAFCAEGMVKGAGMCSLGSKRCTGADSLSYCVILQ